MICNFITDRDFIKYVYKIQSQSEWENRNLWDWVYEKVKDLMDEKTDHYPMYILLFIVPRSSWHL